MRTNRSWLCLSGSLLLGACGSSDSGASIAFDGRGIDGTTGTAAGTGGDTTNMNSGTTTTPDGMITQPEVELESSFRAPVVTGKYVWTANPESGRVAVIDSESYEIRAGDAGFGPTHLVALEETGTPRALVINVNSNDATLLELSGAGPRARATIPLHESANAWSVSPNRRFAIAWTDSVQLDHLDPTDGFQDITVIELRDEGEPRSTRLTVGYRPSSFGFREDSGRAFAVTQDGISLIELESGNVRLTGLVSIPNAGQQPDVTITPNGRRALARAAGQSQIYDIDLDDNEAETIELGGVVTDLDLSRDGSMAVAVIRQRVLTIGEGSAVDASVTAGEGASDTGDAGTNADSESEPDSMVTASEAVFIPIPEGLESASERSSLTLSDEVFGSVTLSPDGSRAILYTNALASGRVVIADDDLDYRSVVLQAPVRGVFVTEDGSHAIALQDPAAGSSKPGAFSVIPVTDVRSPKIVGTNAPVESVALLPNSSDRALVTISDTRNTFGTYLVRMPNLQVDLISLPSRPLATGMVPTSERGFVAQSHPEGRITFVTLSSGDKRDITGFELADEVVDE